MATTRTKSGKSISGKRDPVTSYARGVVAGAIVAGPFVRLAAKRHIRDLDEGPRRGLRWNLDAALRALGFFPEVLTVECDPDDESADPGARSGLLPFRLLPCWEFVVGSIFGWQRREGDRWVRRFRKAYIEAGKGSGKTPVVGGIGLYMMLADGEMSAECYAAGSKRDQAMILFGDVVKMVDRSPQLRRRLVQSGKNPVWALAHRPSASIFRPLSSDKKKSGPRVHFGAVDELHEHKDRYTIDMLVAGFKRRAQPLMVAITNSGFDRESICWEYHENAVAVVEQLRVDDAFFSFVMSLDDGDDPLEDESCWPKTNPGIGVTVTLAYLRSQVSDARQIPGRESGVRRLNFCQWTDADIGWMTRAAWMSCEEEITTFVAGAGLGYVGKRPRRLPADDPFGLEGAKCFLGLDLSWAFDLTALAVVFPEGDELLAWIEYFTPRETAVEREKKDGVPYLRWIEQGLIHGVPGKIVRKEYMAERILRIADTFDVQWAAYDRYRHKELADEMQELGCDIPWIEHPQGFRRAGQLDIKGADGEKLDNPLYMPDSVDKLEARIIEKTLRVQPSVVTRWQVSSVVVRQDPRGTGNRMFDKAKSVGRIDGLVALAMAGGAAEMRLPVMSLQGFLNKPVMTR